MTERDATIPLKTSSYAFVFENSKERAAAVYHSLTMELLYCRQPLNRLLTIFRTPSTVNEAIATYRGGNHGEGTETIQRFVSALKHARFLVEEGEDERSFESAKREAQSLTPEISVMYLLLSDDCNMACRYCTVNYNVRGNPFKRMPASTIERAVNLFKAASTPARKKRVNFFGGEPLLNSAGLARALDELHKHFDRAELSLEMVTNGTLIDDDVADLILKHDIFPIISMDGPPLIHDQMRVRRNGQGSFEAVHRGFETLKKKGVSVGVSTLVGKHNYKYLPEIVAYFSEHLGALDAGFSLPHVEPDVACVDMEELVPPMIEAWRVGRELGFYIVQMGSRLRPFIVQKPRLNACPGPMSGWGMFRVLPSGAVTVCENMGLRGQCVLGNVNDSISPQSLQRHPDILNWTRRSQYLFDECNDCFAIGVCGAGCSYDAYLETGTIFAPERRNCYLCKEFLKWAIWDLHRELLLKRNKKTELPFTIVTRDDRQLAWGNNLAVLHEHPFLSPY